jgi:hypothetical protein
MAFIDDQLAVVGNEVGNFALADERDIDEVPSRVVLELGDASLGSIRLSDHAARSMI